MTYTKEQSLTKIEELVRDFRDNEVRLRKQAEAMIENNFIRPLFKYLNWNTSNEGLKVADYEFILNRTTRSGKRPDYTLQLDGQHLLVMDAKQVKYDMHETRWLNQVYSYAYSTQNLALSRKIDFAVLTDFEEFLVLDCTLHVNNPKALKNFIVLNWTFEDYLKQFDRFWELFERDSMRRAARTRYSNEPKGIWSLALSPKKVKANRTPPDKAFLFDMDGDQDGWRVRLAKNMKKHNPQADGTLITAAVQLLIDRLIFVKALSDREIEEDYLERLALAVEKDGLDESDTGWFTACREIFSRLNKFYNGSIFEPRPELENVTVSNKVVRDIIRSLQPENSPYNFAVMPVEILGTIYERFLGRVVRTTEQRVKIEEKPEVRKAGGVYYTPQYIVDYIVKNTVGNLLEKCKTPQEAAKLKILDPACGSGSFLVGAYSALIQWYTGYYDIKKRLTENDRNDAYYDSEGRVRLTARLKRQILLNNLFGVDIDPQAVEVTRFSLSLKALEDTDREELNEERSLFKETVLPDLSQNIKCGNSLIGDDYYSVEGGYGNTRLLFPGPETMRRVNAFNWEKHFPAIFAEGGFDIVIGNPPYIRIQTLQEYSTEQLDYLKQIYRSTSSGNYDIYVAFVEKGLNLLNKKGRLGFIIPHKFFNSKYGEPLRRLIAKGKNLVYVVHFGDQQVFEGATTYTALIFLDKAGDEYFQFVSVKDLQSWRSGETQPSGILKIDQTMSAEWNFVVGKDAELFERLRHFPVKLENIAHIFVGLQTSADKIYILEEINPPTSGFVKVKDRYGIEFLIEHEIVKPFLNNVTVSTYEKPKSCHWLLFPYYFLENKAILISPKDLSSSFPKAWSYFQSNNKDLRNRESGKADNENWYGYIYRKNLTLFEDPKLIVQVISKSGRYARDDSGIYFTGGGNGPYYGLRWSTPNNTNSLYYLQAILNSKLLDFYHHKISSPFRGGYWSYGKRFIELIPIRLINFDNPKDKSYHDQILNIVSQMIILHNHKASLKTQHDQEMIQRQIDATDRQIDALVYELYGLTPGEIEIIEGAMKRV